MIIYYTDLHDVDEDLKTIAQHGGFGGDGNGNGITHRLVFDSQLDNLHVFSDVASMCRHPKLIKYCTDNHDVDEDLTTIPYCGGRWTYESRVGIAGRAMDNISSSAYPTAASSTVEILILYGYS